MMKTAMLGFLAAVVVMAPHATRAAPTTPLTQVGVFDVAPPTGNTSCLSPTQEKQLKEAITTIRDLFRTAIVALDIAYAAEKDPTIKHNLQTAITVLQAVNQDILANLTAIAESACPTCSNITYVIQQSVDVIEETLEKIDPNWQHNPIWKAVFTLVDSLLNVVKDFCPTTTLTAVVPAGNTSCLTPTQEKQLEAAIATIKGLFKTAIAALDVAYAVEKDPTTKQNIGTAITVLEAINVDILSNLTSIAESACPTCTNITAVIRRSVAAIEETLAKIDPNWQNDPLWKAVFTLVNTLLDVVNDFCPPPEVVTLAVPNNSSCLTPTQEKQLKEAITTINGLFKTAIVALDIAYAAEKDPATKHNIQTAITVLQAVDQDVLANLTAIAESACPTCSNITYVIQQSVDVIEETLEKIDPNWQHNPIWKAVFSLVDTLLNVVKGFCPTQTVDIAYLTTSSTMLAEH